MLQHALRCNSLGESEKHQENLGRRNCAHASRDAVERNSNLRWRYYNKQIGGITGKYGKGSRDGETVKHVTITKATARQADPVASVKCPFVIARVACQVAR